MTDQTPAAPAGWYHDPTAQADGRYWDGSSWTDTVSRGGVTVHSPMDPSLSRVPPVPGSELVGHDPTPPETAPPHRPTEPQRSGSPVTVVLGLLVAAALAIGLVFFFLADDDSSDDPTPSTEAPATTAPPDTEPPATTSAPPTTSAPTTTS